MKKYRVHFRVRELSKRYVEVEAATDREACKLCQDIVDKGDPCGWTEYSYNGSAIFQDVEELS